MLGVANEVDAVFVDVPERVARSVFGFGVDDVGVMLAARNMSKHAFIGNGLVKIVDAHQLYAVFLDLFQLP